MCVVGSRADVTTVRERDRSIQTHTTTTYYYHYHCRLDDTEKIKEARVRDKHRIHLVPLRHGSFCTKAHTHKHGGCDGASAHNPKREVALNTQKVVSRDNNRFMPSAYMTSLPYCYYCYYHYYLGSTI